ncbi:hypothetical protein BUALT_Bualt10G0106300 [Buddleja alternifolia]|uniref:Uncharacterized protein n=1 Tax=Buddleja alternifolia TaxID=168488 RepID=A0AAV6X2B0_9LAMI|nr:hypothetical protein BUALT_Bualt10G0106300 [Buddleja alternifolia]
MVDGQNVGDDHNVGGQVENVGEIHDQNVGDDHNVGGGAATAPTPPARAPSPPLRRSKRSNKVLKCMREEDRDRRQKRSRSQDRGRGRGGGRGREQGAESDEYFYSEGGNDHAGDDVVHLGANETMIDSDGLEEPQPHIGVEEAAQTYYPPETTDVHGLLRDINMLKYDIFFQRKGTVKYGNLVLCRCAFEVSFRRGLWCRACPKVPKEARGLNKMAKKIMKDVFKRTYDDSRAEGDLYEWANLVLTIICKRLFVIHKEFFTLDLGPIQIGMRYDGFGINMLKRQGQLCNSN